MTELKKYSKELLASKIGQHIHETGNDFLSEIEIEFEECTASLFGTAYWRENIAEELEFAFVDLSELCLQFDESETNFTRDELIEMERLVKMYYP